MQICECLVVLACMHRIVNPVHLYAFDVAAGSNRKASTETLTTNFSNMRTKEEPTALLETISHLVDHIY